LTTFFDRMVESGGSLTSRDRGRRSLTVWLAASDRLLRHLQVIGLRRLPRPVEAPLDYIQVDADE
jgi:hypothetical protein